ncbi:hypothetical protein [Telmatospirillum sp. J64-1]|uniref:hypothetical protein n=1 Tax=Telmatospirillum sp. J64-1 TaxID=2502183 RepID=UPI00115D4436|nr:hypothetical protein [Telmatospirillum sp. J64-1]
MTVRIATVAACALFLAAPAWAGELDALAGWQEMPGEELASAAGRYDNFEINTNVTQNNNTNIDSANNNNTIGLGNGASMNNGAIGNVGMSHNSGVLTVMQNTGNLVNMNHAMSVNVYLQ